MCSLSLYSEEQPTSVTMMKDEICTPGRDKLQPEKNGDGREVERREQCGPSMKKESWDDGQAWKMEAWGMRLDKPDVSLSCHWAHCVFSITTVFCIRVYYTRHLPGLFPPARILRWLSNWRILPILDLSGPNSASKLIWTIIAKQLFCRETSTEHLWQIKNNILSQ